MTRWALRNDRVVLLVVVLVWLFACGGLWLFPSQEDPTVTVKTAIVSTAHPGMSAERVERLITERLETEIQEVAAVREIRSVSKTGLSRLWVRVEDGEDLERAWTEVRRRVARAAPYLPKGVQGPIVDDDFGKVAIALVTLRADGFEDDEIRATARWLRLELLQVKGVGTVEIHGLEDEEIVLRVDPARMGSLGVAPATLLAALRQTNVISSGGMVDVLPERIPVQPTGEFETLEDLADLVVANPQDGTVARLRDLVEIERVPVDPPTTRFFQDGEAVVGFAISQVEGGNVLKVGRRLRQRLAELQNELHLGYELQTPVFQADLVQTSRSDFLGNLGLSILIVLAIMLAAMGPRTGVIVSALIPTTMAVTLLGMLLLGIPIHRVSIAAMIIAIGILIDNGIVMSETIRQGVRQLDLSPVDAAQRAGQELMIPLLSSSLTTILAFLPLALAQSETAEYTRSLFTVISLALLASWVLSMTAIPVLLVRYGRPAEGKDLEERGFARAITRTYRRGLAWVLGHRRAFSVGVVGLLLGTGALALEIRKEFFPPSERAQFAIKLELPNGRSIRETERVTTQVSAWLRDDATNPEIGGVLSYVGYGGPRFYLPLEPPPPDPGLGFLIVDVASLGDVVPVAERVEKYLLERHPDLLGQTRRLMIGGGGVGLVEVVVEGDDLGPLFAAVAQVKSALRDAVGTRDVKDDWGVEGKRITVEVDQTKARRAGVTSLEVATTLETMLSGRALSELREEDRSVPIVLTGDRRARSLDRLQTLEIQSSAKATTVPLAQVASFELDFEPAKIRRLDRTRAVTVTARPRRGVLASELDAEVRASVESLDLPTGVEIHWRGEWKEELEANLALFAGAPMALFGIVVILVWQFNSIRMAIIILSTALLATIGVVPGLVLTGAHFGFMASLGCFSLLGIVVNDAIVLLDRIRRGQEDDQLSAYDAIVEAGARRLWPILLTTMTTIAGLLPLILWGGPLWYAMGNVIAFGLGSATLLILGMAPVLYARLYNVDGVRRRGRKGSEG